MPRVAASALIPGTVAEAEALWYDQSRWPSFVDGFHHVVRHTEDWPQKGSKLLWESTPHGRGKVVERVLAYEPLAGQTVEVEEQRLTGTQRVAFRAEGDDAVRVDLELEYVLANRNPLTPLLDALFVRRALRDSLRRTVVRFARERVAEAELT